MLRQNVSLSHEYFLSSRTWICDNTSCLLYWIVICISAVRATNTFLGEISCVFILDMSLSLLHATDVGCLRPYVAHTHTHFCYQNWKMKNTQVTSHVVIVSKEGHTFPSTRKLVTITFNSVGKLVFVCERFSYSSECVRHISMHTNKIFMVKNSNNTCNINNKGEFYFCICRENCRRHV